MGEITKNAGLEIRAQVKALKDKRLMVSLFRNLPNVYLEKWQVFLVCFFCNTLSKSIIFVLKLKKMSKTKS